MCTLDHCCCCIDLRVGSLIIGYLSLIGNIVFSFLVGATIVGGGVLLASDDKDAKQAGTIFLVIGIIFFVFLIINLAFTITLLIGLHKEKRGHVKAYLIFSMIFIVLTILEFLAGFAGKVTTTIIIQKVLNILFSIYFWVVIKSYWEKMGEGVSKNRPTYTA